ncbi:hypothetical protein SEA_MAGRITTE_174 [Microbacterium phage Magritte]|nr:hypothetical protein SEA_MAGRITTE_174 [Microbacterium phage Magritte]
MTDADLIDKALWSAAKTYYAERVKGFPEAPAWKDLTEAQRRNLRWMMTQAVISAHLEPSRATYKRPSRRIGPPPQSRGLTWTCPHCGAQTEGFGHECAPTEETPE